MCPTSRTRACAFHPTAKRSFGMPLLASTDTIYGTATWKQLPAPPTLSTPCGLALHPTRRLVATGWSDDSTLRLWEMAEGQERMQTICENVFWREAFPQFAFTPDGRYLAVGIYNNAVSLLR